jgi:uncharacterized membrane protein
MAVFNKMQPLSLVAYLAVAGVMIACDLLFIRLRWRAYAENIARIQKNPANLWKPIAIPIYILMYAAVILVAVPLYPEYNAGAGALVGLVVYGVYDLCMVLQFEDNSISLAAIDTLWGTALFTGLTQMAVSL